MVDSAYVAAVVAQFAFWILLVLGVVNEDLKKSGAAVLVLLWLAGSIALPRIAWWTGSFVTTWVAVLDVVLVFKIFKGDVRLT